MILSHRHWIILCGLRAFRLELARVFWLPGELRATARSMMCRLCHSDRAFSTAWPGQNCIAVCRVLLDGSRGDSHCGPQLVLRLFQWKRRWGSIPQWAGLRARRHRRFERCACRLDTLEPAHCLSIALVLTACVPSTAPGLFLVMSFEYGGHLGRSRCARAQTRAA